jgi:vacuolar protein sorting-associated protein 16
LDIYNSDDFVDMCETLRVLNAVRYYEIGLPLSYDQFLRLTPEKLVERLVNRREYLLALRISSYLRLPTDRIYVHWASQKVRISSEDEDTICRLIVEKLAGKRGISFEEIARAAYDEGRGHLATELLNHEPRAGKQVPLLLSMEEDEIALDKAIESGDSDLIFFVLLQLKRKLPLASFFRIINGRPVATALIESSAQAEDAELLKDLYYQDDRRVDGSNVFVREALKQPNSRAAIDKLGLASKLLNDSKDTAFELKAIQEASQLLKMQEAFDRDLEETYTGLSVNETLYRLMRAGYAARAKKVQSEFKVPEKTIWWIRLVLNLFVQSSLTFCSDFVPLWPPAHGPRSKPFHKHVNRPLAGSHSSVPCSRLVIQDSPQSSFPRVPIRRWQKRSRCGSSVA